MTADVGSKTLTFRVTSEPPAVVKPQAGLWHSTGLTGPYRQFGGRPGFSDSMEVTQLFFEVAPDRVTISKFRFSYSYSGPLSSGETRSGSVNSVESEPSPVTNGQFSDPGTGWSGGELFRFQGTFDSPTTAHGTAQFGTTITDIGCNVRLVPLATGTFSWTASR